MQRNRYVRFGLYVAVSISWIACGGSPRPPADVATVAPPEQPAPPPLPTVGPFAPKQLMADVMWLTDPAREGRGSYQAGSAHTARWIAARFRSLGLEVIRQPVGRGAENVIAIRRAGQRAVVISAHYDHLGRRGSAVFPGADDNASGTAVLLALAAFHARRSYTNTLVFIAFGAEEVGLVGSGTYMKRPAWPLERTVAVVNFDMVGRRFFDAGASRDRVCAVIGLEQDTAVRAAAMRSAAAAGLTLVPSPAQLAVVFGQDYRTDEWWFRRRGTLAVHFTTGYHHDSDTADKIVPGQLSRVAQTAAGVVAHLAGHRLAPDVSQAAASSSEAPVDAYDSE